MFGLRKRIPVAAYSRRRKFRKFLYAILSFVETVVNVKSFVNVISRGIRFS